MAVNILAESFHDNTPNVNVSTQGWEDLSVNSLKVYPSSYSKSGSHHIAEIVLLGTNQ
jgi:hypothetical protein